MFQGRRQPSALHLYDCADVGATLVQYGRVAGLPWRHLPVRDAGRDKPSMLGTIRRSSDIAGWTARRWLRSVEADLLHIHFGTRLDVLRKRPHRPFIVHYHGTDIRDFYCDPSQRDNIQWGADNAAAVLYSTPDLKTHAEAARADAIYLPNPVNRSELPLWQPSTEPRIVFSSRWDASKGGEQQLELLSEIRRILGTDVLIQGLDWGEGASEARRRGADLVPKMAKPDYLRWLSSAHCVVGQMSGSLGMSELQALAMGAPVAAKLGDGYYPGPSPVIGGEGKEDLAANIALAVADPVSTAEQLQPRKWIDAHHDPESVVQRLATIYRRLA